MSKDHQQAPLWKAAIYCLFNIVVASGIVFANKAVFQFYHFKFVTALTWIHTMFTWGGMHLLACSGMFQPKPMPAAKLTPLAMGYVGYIVLCNVSLNLNSVGFYQIMKIAVAPTVVVLEFLMFRKLPSFLMQCSVVVVCAGITLATVTDTVVIQNSTGLVIGVCATFITALYQIWAGSKQKELQANSSQLLLAYTPQAAGMLAVLVPLLEPVGWKEAKPDTLLGYSMTWPAAAAIILSAVLGILVSLSTFLVIGATNSLTYNIVGHVKTVIILTGGVMWFGDSMSYKRLGGICVAMAGIIWYTQLLVTQQPMPVSPSLKATPSPNTSPRASMLGERAALLGDSKGVGSNAV